MSRIEDQGGECDIQTVLGRCQSDDRLRARELMDAMATAAEALAVRHGWSPARVSAALMCELQERLQDAAVTDAEFRAWYQRWRRDNPEVPM
jgi:hypothetical protein